VLYDIIDVPPETPVTIPVVASTVATAVFPLFHDPPEVTLLNVVEAPAQAVRVPEMTPGNELTESAIVDRQVVGNV
jgi:hypothetical protein